MNGKGLADYAVSKKGTPYFYGSKMSKLTNSFMATMHKMYPSIVTDAYMTKAKAKGQIGVVNTDCSGLPYGYTGKMLGSAQLYSQAYARLPISTWEDWAPGVITWREGHVGVYIGNGKVVEAKGIDYGTIETKITDGRWKYGLTFSWIDYTYDNAVTEITYKGENPYMEPTRNLSKGVIGEDVKWLQWELNEAGYSIAIDGQFGSNTRGALTAYQSSAKLVVDGICGPATIRSLKGVGNPYTLSSTLMKRGATGTSVKWLQYELNQNGANLAVDGIFGNDTFNAVVAYQKAHGLAVDGIVGPKTIASLS